MRFNQVVYCHKWVMPKTSKNRFCKFNTITLMFALKPWWHVALQITDPFSLIEHESIPTLNSLIKVMWVIKVLQLQNSFFKQ